jgi:hypothetical protein
LAVTFLVRNDRWLWASHREVIDHIDAVAASAPPDIDRVKSDLAAWIETRLIDAADAHVRIQAGLRPEKDAV